MYYYEVIPADRSYKGSGSLTYSSDLQLKSGQIIVVMLRTKKIKAVVTKKVNMPTFNVKPVYKVVTNSQLSKESLKFIDWISQYYAVPVSSVASLMLPPTTTISEEKVSASPAEYLDANLPTLTMEQAKVLADIQSSNTRTHIVHGDTGTGKTRLYIELMKQCITDGKSAIILTPEINLTPQLLATLQKSFSMVHVVHSKITPAQRTKIWNSVRSNQPHVLIGPRSALFYPIPNIGLIVVDEFHDSSYKQQQAPRYNAVRVSASLSRSHGARLILGSATPPVEDFFYAVSKGAKVHRLTEKAVTSTFTTTTVVVDLSDASEKSSHPLLSKTLIQSVRNTLDDNKQCLLFLNKRGTSRKLLCQKCGWSAICDRCNINYTYHEDSHSLVCHTCGESTGAPNNCAECKSSDIIFKSPGTKQIESSLRKLFPTARIGRYDKDNKTGDTFQENYEQIHSGKVDILIGTQLVVKGHDLPKLSLVSILLAEDALKFPDFSSEEKSFQLLHQVSGRVGRGHGSGTIILQSYGNAKELSLLSEQKNSWETFYKRELIARQKYGFPPFRYLMKIELSRASEASAEKASRQLHKQLLGQCSDDVEILDPSPSFFSKRAGKWHWQVVAKSKKRASLIALLEHVPKTATTDLDPSTLL